MAYMIRGPDGSETGPVELETLVQWVQSGSLPAHAPVRDLVTGVSTVAGQMSELRSLYSGTDFSKAPEPIVATKSKGSALIPSGNPKALTAYYTGVASLIPCLGLLTGPVAIILGFQGIRAYNENPAVFGKGHGIAGIVLGSICFLANIAGLVWLRIIAQP